MPKYLRLEMQAASGSTLPARGVGEVSQIVRITNSMQVRRQDRRVPWPVDPHVCRVLYHSCVVILVGVAMSSGWILRG